MRKFKFLSAIAVATMPMSLVATSCGQLKEKDVYRDINLDENWTFRLNDDTQEQVIDLPHDFSIIQDFKHTNRDLRKRQSSGTTGFLPGGVGYYHKDFVLPKKDNATVILDFDGAYNDTLVTINGQIVGNNRYGYNPFAFDISNYVIADGETVNKLDVIVKHEYVTSSRWYPGSGIYRDVNVSVVDKLHVAHDGTYVTTPNLKQEVGGDVTVNVDVDVQNSYDTAKSAYVRNRVINANGEAVSDWSSTAQEKIDKQETHTFKSTVKVSNPDLWSDKNPNLYYVETQVVTGSRIIDQYKTRFGFRYFEFDNKGFHVNGNLVKLHGVCLHHDQGALGAAAYNDAIYRQLSIMKEMGMNAVRTSHNCPDEDFLRICDELGLYVMDEAFDGWEFSKTQHDFGETWKKEIGYGNQLIDATPNMQWHSYVMHTMVKRDRNCPSVFMWSLGNELHEGAWHDEDVSQAEKDRIKAEMIGYGDELSAIAHDLDNNDKTKRWTGIALEHDPFGDAKDWPKCNVGMKLYEDGGVLGFNYASNSQIETAIAKNIDRLYGSETASANNSRGMYGTIDDDENEEHFRVTSYDTAGRNMASEVIWQTLHYDGYAGQFVWTGFDYIGEPSPWCWNCEDDSVDKVKWPYPNSAYYGIVDTCGFPKDSYYLYRSHLRQDDTTLHLVGSLNQKNMYIYSDVAKYEGFTPVDIYTNAPYVLIKDGNEVLAEVNQTETSTSRGEGSYYTYKATSKDSTRCIVNDPQSKKDVVHDLYTTVLIDPEKISQIHAEAYKEDKTTPITETKGLKQLDWIDSSTTNVAYNIERENIPADGKSLSYVAVDLNDANGNLITDFDSQQDIEVKWTGAGKVLGVDNGYQATDEKWQNPNIFNPKDKIATIKTFAGKAIIIVCSDKTPGDITLTMTNKTTGATKTLTIHAI